MASAKLVASEAWNEPIRPETLKHRRFIWATQFGCGASGANTRKRTRVKLTEPQKEREKARVAAKRAAPRVIWPGPSEMPAEFWRNAS